MRKKQLTLEKFIIYIIGFIALVLMLLIWPYGIIKSDTTSRSIAEDDRSTGAITWDMPVIQEFVPQHDFIKSIEISLDRNQGESVRGRFYFKVFDRNLELVKTYEMNIVDLEDKSYTEMPLNVFVESGQTYYFRIEVKHEGDIPPKLCYRTLSGAGPMENRTFYYGSQVLEDASASVRYNYKQDLRVSQILVYDSFILLAALFLYSVLKKKYSGRLDRTICAGVRNRTALTVLGNLFWLGCGYFLMIRKIFGGTGWDMGIYLLAVSCAVFLWSYMVWRIPWKNPFEGRDVKQVLTNGIQILCYAVVCISSTYYFNSGSNYGHAIGTRYILIAFGVSLTVYFTRRELFRRILLGYDAAALAAVLLYLVKVLPGQEKYHLFILNGLTSALWGMLLLLMLLRGLRKELPKLSVSFAAAAGLFFVLLLWFRNTRTWPFTLVIPFTVFYLLKLDKKQTNQLMKNFCNGLILSFAYLAGRSVLFRPYYSHNYARYPLYFDSVAIAAIYELAVFCAAFTKVIARMQEWKETGEEKIFRFVWKELVVFGVVVSYLMLSLSRTALLGVAAAAVVTFPVVEWCVFKDRIKTLLARGLLFVWAVCLTFPVTYTVTRCLPALVSRPYIMDTEVFKGNIVAGEKIDSYRFMNFRRYLDLSADKIMVYIDKLLGTEASEEYEDASYLGTDALLASAFRQESTANGNINNQSVSRAEKELLAAADTQQEILMASADTSDEEDENEISNGRIDIFMAYLKQLDFKGHESMVLFEDGEPLYYHAHNSFIQTAYDNGIQTAFMFIVLGIFGFIRSIFIYKRYAKEMPCSIISLIVITGFGVASLTEWVFHPCIVLGFACFFVLKPLLFRLKDKC